MTLDDQKAIQRIRELYELGANVHDLYIEYQPGTPLYRAIYDIGPEEFVDFKRSLQYNEQCKHNVLVQKALIDSLKDTAFSIFPDPILTDNTLSRDDD